MRLVATEIREGKGRIVQCFRCGLVRQDLNWSKSRLRRYYNDVYQKTNSLEATSLQSPRCHFESRRQTLGPLLARLIPALKPTMRVLDLGCGAGELLHAIRPKVREVVGFEINKRFVEFMRRSLGIEAYHEDFTNFEFGARRFDLVLSIDALDHLPNPAEALRSIRRLLAANGRAYLEVPNVEEALGANLPEKTRALYRTFFWHRAHFSYFSKKTLKGILARNGFRSSISCRHQYTLKNFLNWYFCGKPQSTFVDAATNLQWFEGKDEFERGMNRIFRLAERQFHACLGKTGRGDTLCCWAVPFLGRG